MTAPSLIRSLLAAFAAVALLMLLGAPGAMPAGTPEGEDSGAKPERSSSHSQRVQMQIRGCINRRRIGHGLSPLELSAPLESAAELHASSMREKGFFDHVDPSGRDPGDRVGMFARKSRFTPIGENIAGGFGSAKSACKEWMNSPSHRDAILDPTYNVTGAGYAKGGEYGSYFVQVFGRER